MSEVREAVPPSPIAERIGIEVVEELAAANQERYGNERRRFVSLEITHDDLPRADLIPAGTASFT
jgi:hypothetical protein